LLSKNVCHGVKYDKSIHNLIEKKVKNKENVDEKTGLIMLYELMEIYLKKKGYNSNKI
jgi:hypothetical protein